MQVKLSALFSILVVAVALALPTRAQTPDIVEVVEYYHSGLDHYFITADPNEMATLDAAARYGWVRTQATFQAYAPSGPTTGVLPVCRFYGLPSAGLDSHFYTASTEECEDTAAKYASSWQKESSNVFRAALPDRVSGDCPADLLPVYRLFNARTDANHRYTTDLFVRAQMILAGYQPEGFGPNGVVFCAPKPAPTAEPKIVATKVAADTYGFSGSGGSTTAMIMGYEWDFGDGTKTGLGATALHKYTTSGSYTVTLTVTDQKGARSVTSTRVDPAVPSAPGAPPPTAPSCTLSASNLAPAVGTTITLLANCNGAPRIYAWTNCASTSNACVSHVASPGVQTYTVSAQNSAGNGSPATINVNWGGANSGGPPPAAAPNCTVTASAPSAVVGTAVSLTAACSGAPTAYSWTNCTSGTATCLAQSAAAGTRSYSVVATNAAGASAPAATQIVWTTGGTPPPTTPPPTAPASPSCTLSASAASVVLGNNVTLTASCTGSPTSYTWTGCASVGATCVAAGAAAGPANYSVTARNAGGTSTPVSTQVTWIAAPAGPPPIVGAPGTWTKFPTSYRAGTEAPKQSWYNLTWDTQRNRAYGISWFKTVSAFDPATGRWTDVRAGSGIMDFHNRTIVYDPLNDRIWASDGTGAEARGFQYFDLGTNQWNYLCTPGCGEPGYEAAMFYDAANKRLITFGGWVDTRVRTFSLQPVGSSWQNANVPGGPTLNTDFEKMSAWRSVHDTARQRMIYVDDDGSLWVLPMSLSGWQHVATIGTPPPEGTQFVYDAANDAIVGWSASPRIAVDDPTPGTTRQTWLLALGTLTWSLAANAAAGVPTPPNTSYVGYAMVYDPVRQQTIVHSTINNSEYDLETWAFRHPGAGAVPPAPPPPVTPAPPSCTLAASDLNPIVGVSLTLTASCTGSPTSYTWTNCASAGATCTAQSGVAGAQSYGVAAANAGGAGAPVTVQVAWTAAPVTPPPPVPPPTGTVTGTITSFPLPATQTAPFTTAHNHTKHVNMASDGKRLYASGGDWLVSATDGTWSMDLSNGTWRQDVGVPIYPSRPAPHALQDGAGFVWVASRQRFLMWPGSYFAYDPPGSPILDYARGMWWFDPATNSYTQETGLFGTPGTSTGNFFGGIYDDVKDQIVAFGDSGSGFVVRRWSVSSLSQLPNLSFNVSLQPAWAAYFTRGMHVKIGRHVYIVGYRTDGNRWSQKPLLLRWHLDNQTMEELAPPPVDGTRIVDLEIRMGTSKGKLVWPFVTGPDGEIDGIYIYDPATNAWVVDRTVPAYGSFVGNSVTSLPDGRVAWAGASFGRQQTHIWFYEAR